MVLLGTGHRAYLCPDSLISCLLHVPVSVEWPSGG